MTKRFWIVIVSVLVLMLLLSGCNLSASDAPATPTSQGTMPTPIRIETDSPISQTQTAIAEEKALATPTLTLEPTDEVEATPSPTPTNTQEPTQQVVVPTLTRPATYTLREGEFPYCIARRYNLNPEDLLDLNDLDEDELVRPGTTLQIPQTGSWTEGSRARNTHPTTHTVKSGETIYSIACYYGDVSPEAIIAVNNLQEPYTLTTGQTLDIP
jgi:LysM repeat protein